jgi:hypothetical protein
MMIGQHQRIIRERHFYVNDRSDGAFDPNRSYRRVEVLGKCEQSNSN